MTENMPPPLPDENTLEKLRSGQRLIIAGILLNIVTAPLRMGQPDNAVLAIGGLLGLAAIVLSIIGLLRMGSGLGIHLAWRIVLCVLMIVPLINLITLLLVNVRATRRLRDNGFKVGLLGARKGSAACGGIAG